MKSGSSNLLAKLTWPGVRGEVTLDQDFQFHASGAPTPPERAFLKAMAACGAAEAAGYSYGPGHGNPGGLLARRVAEATGGQGQVLTEAEPGKVY